MSLGVYVTIWIALGFLAGSVPFGWIIARLKGINITEHGSGNIGMTNVWRVMGWPYGLTVLILDALKGLLPVISIKLCIVHMADTVPAGFQPWLVMFVGFAAILGHTFTPWLRFKGGKGVATGLGVIIALMGVWCLAPLGAFLLIVLTTRMVSLGSILAALLVGATIPTVPTLRPYWLFAILVPVLVIWSHRENIGRILNGTERKIGGKKDEKDKDSAEPEAGTSSEES